MVSMGIYLLSKRVFLTMDFFMDSNIARAKTISTDFYMSREVFELTKEKIFADTWQFVGSSDLIKEKGDVYPLTLLDNFLDEPLMLTKNDSGIDCLSNVCTHRGNIVAYEKCNAAHLRCKYHGRQFQLDGKFVSMPEFKEVENFPTAEDDLKKVQIHEWNKWLFVSLNAKLKAESFLKE